MNSLEFLVNHQALVRRNLKGESNPLLSDGGIKQTQNQVSVIHKDCVAISNNRRGRGHASSSGVEFKRQQEFTASCLRTWSHQQKCCFLEELLRHSSTAQIQFLYTVLQPSVHRDFMYAMRSRFPEIEFSPVSTYITRHIKKRLRNIKQLRSFYRVDSAYVQQEEDVARVKFPPLSHQTFFTARKKPAVLKMKHGQKDTNDSQAETKSIHADDSLTISLTKRTQNSESNLTAVSMPTSHLPKEAMPVLTWYTQHWRDNKRNEFLEQLIQLLDPRQIYFVTKYLSFKQEKDIIGLLPKKLALQILAHLSVRQLLTACKVSKRWKRLAESNVLWKVKCKEVTLHVPVPVKPKWKLVYRDNCHLRYNWNNARFDTIQLSGHNQSVQCVTCYGNKVATGSADQTIIIWDINTGNQEQVLRGHTKGVWCLQFFTKHLLISGSFDCTIRMWNLRTEQTTRTFFGHKNQILCLKLRGSLMVSGSQDKMAMLWDVGHCQLLQTLIGHTAAVFSVDISEDSKVVLTAGGDKTVRLWDRDSGLMTKCIWVSPNNCIMTISYSQGYFSCAYERTVCLYQGGQLVRTFDEHRQRVEGVKLIMTDADNGEGYMVSAGQDGLIKYWSLTEDQSLHTIAAHKQPINSIYVDELRLATASSDQTANIYNFNVGLDMDD